MQEVNWNQMQKDIKKATEKAGFNYIADRPLTNHPDDWYLRVVLGYNEREHATWIYNASLGGLHEGHYMMTRERASDDFNERG